MVPWPELDGNLLFFSCLVLTFEGWNGDPSQLQKHLFTVDMKERPYMVRLIYDDFKPKTPIATREFCPHQNVPPFAKIIPQCPW